MFFMYHEAVCPSNQHKKKISEDEMFKTFKFWDNFIYFSFVNPAFLCTGASESEE